MASMFADLDFAAAQIIDNSLPQDKYACVISNFERKPTATGKAGLHIYWTIAMGKYAGRTIYEWSEIPTPETQGYTIKSGPRAGTVVSADENRMTLADRLKTRLASIGIPEEKMGSLNADDVIGRKNFVSVKPDKNDPDRTRILKVEPASFSDSEIQAGEVAPVVENPFL